MLLGEDGAERITGFVVLIIPETAPARSQSPIRNERDSPKNLYMFSHNRVLGD